MSVGADPGRGRGSWPTEGSGEGAAASRSRSRARSCSRGSLSPWSSPRPAGRRSRRRSSTGTRLQDNWFPGIAHAFWLNVKLFLIAEVVILVFALVIAILRGAARAGVLPDPDDGDHLHRPVPRRPDDPGRLHARVRRRRRCSCPGVPNSPLFWGIVALVLVYSAYVAEVYRAGIESVHPSQEAAARSLGLSTAPDAAVRHRPAGRAPGDPAAPERLHRPAEGHGAGRADRPGRSVSPVADRRRQRLQLHAVPRARRCSSSC